MKATLKPLTLSAAITACSGVDVDNDIQLGLTFTYMLDQSSGVELLAATPFLMTLLAKVDS